MQALVVGLADGLHIGSARAGLSVVTLAMLPFRDAYPMPSGTTKAPATRGSTQFTLLIPALSAVFLFQGGNIEVAAYSIGLGRSAGLTLSAASSAVGNSSWIGLGARRWLQCCLLATDARFPW